MVVLMGRVLSVQGLGFGRPKTSWVAVWHSNWVKIYDSVPLTKIAKHCEPACPCSAGSSPSLPELDRMISICNEPCRVLVSVCVCLCVFCLWRTSGNLHTNTLRRFLGRLNCPTDCSHLIEIEKYLLCGMVPMFNTFPRTSCCRSTRERVTMKYVRLATVSVA